MSKKDLGREKNRGCSNPRIFYTDGEEPLNPIKGDIWINELANSLQYVKKSANESVTSSTTQQNDDHITFDFPTEGIYEITFFAAATGSSAGDIKIDWIVSGGASQESTRNCQGPSITSGDVTDTSMRSSRHNLTTDVTYGIAAGATAVISESFLVSVTSAGGSIQMRWAQRVSSATATTLSTNTYAICRQLSGNKNMMYYNGFSWVAAA